MGAVVSKIRAVEMSLFPDMKPDRPVGPILPSVFVGSNSDLMAAVAPFYLTGSVCDLTYGEGKWWDRFTPDPFTAHDKFKGDGVDFTALPEADNTYDTVCFDPPYVGTDGASSAAIADPTFQHRYGIGDATGGPSNGNVEQLIVDGVREACRVSRRWVLVKCMEYAKAAFVDMPHIVTSTVLAVGLVKHDQIVHHTGSGPGGHNIFDPKRARRHHSYLLVFAKGKP